MVHFLAVTYRSNTSILGMGGGGPLGWTFLGSQVEGTGLTTAFYHTFTEHVGYFNSLSGVWVSFSAAVKATLMLISVRGVNTTGTNGSGAIDNTTSNSGTTANPALAITPIASNVLVLSILGHGNATAPTAGTGYTLRGTVSSSGGGGGTTKATTSVIASNTLITGTTTAGFNLAAINWTQYNISVK